MPVSALAAVSAGIFARLNVASLKGALPTGAGATGGVKDFVPQAPPFPFVFYELSERDISGLGQGTNLKQLQMRLHVFSQALGAVEAQRIMAEAIRLVQFSEPATTGWTMPAIGRPDDVIPIEFTEINGIVCRELVSVWDSIYAVEAP